MLKKQNTKEFTMKKITMITAIFLLVLSATFADKVISADQLSAGAKDFISKFSNNKFKHKKGHTNPITTSSVF